MKTILLTISLLFSTQLLAAGNVIETIGISTIGVTMSPSITSIITKGLLTGVYKEAQQVVNYSQDFNQSGKLNDFLASKVKQIQEENPDVSDAEAVDSLFTVAMLIINN